MALVLVLTVTLLWYTEGARVRVPVTQPMVTLTSSDFLNARAADSSCHQYFVSDTSTFG